MQRNLWLFMILSAVCLAGWMWLEPQIWPRKDRPPQEQAKATGKDQPPAPLIPPARPVEAVAVASFAASLVGPGPEFGQAVYLASAGLGAEELSQKLKVARFFQSPSSRWALDELTAFLAPDPLGVALHLGVRHARSATPPPQEAEVVKLGGPGFYLEVDLTTRGGGIRRLALLKFQEASREGLPVYQKLPDGTRREAPLELIPDDRELASFLLYHYHKAEDETALTTLGEMIWKLEGGVERREDEQRVTLSTHVPGLDHLIVRRIYTLAKGAYHVALEIEIQDTRKEGGAGTFRYQLAGAHGLPIEGEWYTTIFRNSVIGLVDSRGSLDRKLEDSTLISFRQGGDRYPEGSRGETRLQYAGTTTQYFASVLAVDPSQAAAKDGGVDKKDILAYARPTLQTEERRCFLDVVWVEKAEAEIRSYDKREREKVYLLPRAVQDYETLKPKQGELVWFSTYSTRGRTVVTRIRTGNVARPQSDDITVRAVSEPVTLAPGEKKVHRFLLYHGPVKASLLAQFEGDRVVDPKLVTLYADDLHLRTLTDYRSPGPMGSFFQMCGWTWLLISCTSLMHTLLYYLKFVVLGNEGLSIILLTVVIRSALFPLSRRQTLISQRMQELAPKMKELQEKYKDDVQAKNAAIMELYRKHNVNPVAGCLPLFLQLPIFLGLYYALQESISFRLAPFLWIENLAAPDMLVYWGQGFPWLTDPDSMGGMLYLGPYFNLLPIVAVVLMLWQQKTMMPPPRDEADAANQKMMKYMMIFFGILFYKVAAGLTMYFIATTAWGLVERRMLPKKAVPGAEATGSPEGGTAPASEKSGPKRGKKQRGKKKPPEPEKGLKKVQNWWQELLKQAKKK